MLRDDILLLDMLLAARDARRFASDLTIEEFRASVLHQNAIVRSLEIIGEAASKLSESARKDLPDIPWPEIIGMRHRLIHDYTHVDVGKVWETIRDDLPTLIAQLESVVPPAEDE